MVQLEVPREDMEEKPERFETRIARDIRGWIGWDYIERVATLSKKPTIIRGLFLTGCRAIEFLNLRRGHFADMGGYFEARAIPVFKRYEVVEKIVEDGKMVWYTRPLKTKRTFPLLKTETAKLFWEAIEDLEDELFVFQNSSGKIWKDQYWQLYKLISSIEPPMSPLAPVNESGEQKNLYPHWFRGQRAAQLVVEYDFDVDKLMRFFKWETVQVAQLYAGLSSRDIAIAMIRGKEFVNYWIQKSGALE